MRIPVIMLHSVGVFDTQWNRYYLTIPFRQFEKFCEYLAQNNYRTVSLEEWYSLSGEMPENTTKLLVLTFDDGYLDNWTYAYPILKKFKLQGTIFINPEFVDPSKEPRKNLDDVDSGKVNENDLEYFGFLNWKEIQIMEESGVMNMQSHSMSHNFYFSSDKIIDFYDGQKSYDWIAWYIKPERKPFYITEDQKNFVPHGTPVFESDRALGLRRFFPSEELMTFARNFYSEHTKNTTFDRDKFKQDYLEACTKFIRENKSAGHWETDDELEQRYRYELFNSKNILEEKLRKKVEFLCWPGGGYNDLSIQLSQEAGYKASTFASRENVVNLDNSGYFKRIPRFGLGTTIKTSKRFRLISYQNAAVHRFKSKQKKILYMGIIKSISILFKLWDKVFLPK